MEAYVLRNVMSNDDFNILVVQGLGEVVVHRCRCKSEGISIDMSQRVTRAKVCAGLLSEWCQLPVMMI